MLILARLSLCRLRDPGEVTHPLWVLGWQRDLLLVGRRVLLSLAAFAWVGGGGAERPVSAHQPCVLPALVRGLLWFPHPPPPHCHQGAAAVTAC